MAWPYLVHDIQQSPVHLKENRQVLYVSLCSEKQGLQQPKKKKKKKSLGGSPLISGSQNPVLSYHPTQGSFQKKRGLAVGRD